jgi:hypothetical protein
MCCATSPCLKSLCQLASSDSLISFVVLSTDNFVAIMEGEGRKQVFCLNWYADLGLHK